MFLSFDDTLHGTNHKAWSFSWKTSHRLVMYLESKDHIMATSLSSTPRMLFALTVLGLLRSWVTSFTSPSQLSLYEAHSRPVWGQRPNPSSTASSRTTTIPRSMSMMPVYDELCATLIDQLKLQPTNFGPTVLGGSSSWVMPGNAQGTAAWYTEQSPQYLTGVSMLTRTNEPGGVDPFAEELSIHIWMGPSYDVPHLLLTFGAASPPGQPGPYHVTADYIPRGPTVLGSDVQYLEMYYGAHVQADWLQAYSMPGAQPSCPPAELETRLLASPVRTALVGLSLEDATLVVRLHLQRWLTGWLPAAVPIPARNRGAFNLRDDKLRQFYYRGQLLQQIGLLGPEMGPRVAAANTGPTAEAYVGGGS